MGFSSVLSSKNMKNSWVSFCLLFPAFVLAVLVPVATGQLSPSETRILFQIQKILEYPVALQGWSNWTNFCYLPPSSLRIVCSGTHITELTVIGNKSSPSKTPKSAPVSSIPSQQTLSKSFSIDSFFTVLTKLSNLKVLSLVSLGLWGPLPSKINRLSSLQVLNISSNFIYGDIPPTISKLQSLKSLVLADNLLSGSVPDLRSLAILEELNLGQNQLGQKVPPLGETLVIIILRKNFFRSEIPSRIMELNKLQLLDISFNKFLGPIHSSLFSLPAIQYLNLAYNQLSGALSVNTTCNKNLNFVDISHNLLIGKLPSCIGSNSPSRTVNISWNCMSSGNSKYQHSDSYCHKEAMAVKPPGDLQKQKLSNKLGLTLALIGGVVGMSGVVLLLVCAIIRKIRRRRLEENKYEKSAADKLGSPLPNRRVPQTRLPALGLPPYRVFTLEEIDEATKNFNPSSLASEGFQAEIYKGWLTDGSVVLIKCFKLKQKLQPQTLARHIEELQNLRHRHLVSILGHCTITNQDHLNPASTVFVVNEYVSNGSLKDCLTDWKRKEALKWPQRMGITIGIARGIQHLHTGMVPGIFGNDIKVENILLDETLTAKISNYNILMPLKDEGGLRLPKGSENPEKEDIFQFGAILLQVITGRRVTETSELDDTKSELESGLAEGLKLRGFIDSSILGSFAFDSLKTTIQIAINCLSKDPSKRPSIEDVIWNLQYSMQVQEGWTSSGGNLGTFI
ncbi:probable LRR receptor-like serine/threonine-protein kinase At1g14390 [Momordica charantia]|uniref:non-specific serine/threonine protein kinase n=1 Tax=Momordica charantia TaxID=3673 RepID=A0A6J1DBY8_MOMCH|nr:probable LRR receptor-like serine/threonine-protein kinase At1g14390 [Momordica charantia]